MVKQELYHQKIELGIAHSPSAPSQEQLERFLSVVEVVSFDLFDTLLQRVGLFSPKDLFYQVQQRGEQQLGLRLDHFTTLRVRAENIARVRASGQGWGEITLAEIYQEVGRLLRLDPPTTHRLHELELACERAVLQILPSGQQLWQAALAAGKRVVITSDTYFTADFIAEILQRSGYGNADKLYLSSVWRQTKMAGALYESVVRDLACPSNRILHVGDSQHSDVTMALSQGLRALHLPTAKQQLRRRYALDERPSGNLGLSALLCNLSERPVHSGPRVNRQAVLNQTATENLALLYYGFAAWLLEQLRAGSYQRVYFAARDGLIMKRFFDLVAQTAGFTIDSRYLYVSRAALYPSLIFSDPVTARRLFCRTWDHLTVEATLRRIGLSFAENQAALATHGLTDPARRMDGALIPQMMAFLTSIWSQVEARNEQRYRLLLLYLRQELLLTPEKAAFVDIGWHGSSQDALLKLLDQQGIRKELHGFYLGTFEKPAAASAGFQAYGFLVHDQKPDNLAQLVRFGPSLLELFHSAGHGGVSGYACQGTEVVPLLENNPVEQQQFAEILEPLQTAAFAYIAQQLAQSPTALLAPPDPELVARLALRPVYAPTAAEAAVFGRLQIASDFGGRMKSITGALEWDLRTVAGDLLPDGTMPIWRPGFHTLKQVSYSR